MRDDTLHERRRWGWLARAGVTAVCAFVVVRGVDARGVVEVVARVHAPALGLGLGLFAATGAPLGARWHRLLAAEHLPITRGSAVRLTYESLFYGLALPTSVGGDVYRALRVQAAAGGLQRATVTLLAERVLGAWSLGLVVLLGFLTNPGAIGAYGSPVAALAFVVAVAGGAVFAPAAGGLAVGLLESVSLTGLAGRVRDAGEQVRRYVADPLLAAELVGWSVAIHLLGVVAVWTMSRSIDSELPLAWFVVAVPLAWLVAVLPSLGGFGPREGALAVLLASVGETPERAAALIALQALAVVGRAAVGGLWTLLPR